MRLGGHGGRPGGYAPLPEPIVAMEMKALQKIKVQ